MIISSNELWLSSFRDLQEGDNLEGMFLFEFIQNWINNNHLHFNANLNRIREYWINLNFYCISLCEDRENKELWDQYGDSGKGVAIGFVHKNFDGGDWPLVSSRIEYGNEEALKIFEPSLRGVFQRLQIDNDFARKDLFDTFLRTLLSYLPLFKSEDFSKEQEHRLYVMDKGENNRIPENSIREMNQRRVYVINLPRPTEIVIGPNSNVTPDQILEELSRSEIQNIQDIKVTTLP